MKKNFKRQSAFFNPRMLLAIGLCAVSAFIVLLGLGLLTGSSAQAQGKAAAKAAPVKPEAQNTVISVASDKNDLSAPLRNQPPWPVQGKTVEREANSNPKIPHQHIDSLDPVIEHSRPSALAHLAPSIPAPIRNFDGIPFPGVGCSCAPPDTVGEVGATQFVQMVNEALQVFDKATGVSVLGPVGISSLWAGFGGVCETNGNGDPVVLYDQLANRWVITQFAGTSVPTNECIAISQTSDATGAYYRYSFTLGSNFFDYPHLAVWPDGYYMSMNVFNSAGTAYLGPQAFAFDRAKMLAGLPATFVTPGITGGSGEETFLPADLDGHNLPPAGSPATFVFWPGGASGNMYRVFHFHADFATPANTTFTSFGSVASAGFTEVCPATRACVPQLGGTGSNGLDAIGDRLMFRLAYRKFSDGHEAVVGNFTVSAGGVAGIRWFELRNVTAGPVSLFQESTYQPDTTWRWMGSAAMDNQGNLALGFAASNATINPQIRYAGRLAGDPVATLAQGEATLFAGTGSQTGTGNRWGDYSALTVDPVDDCTFWYTQEYYAATGTFNWRTRAGSFAFTQCTAPTKGTAHFSVVDCSGSAPLAGVLVTIDGNPYGTTAAGGVFDADLAPGNHTYTVTRPNYTSASGNFTITNGMTTNVTPACLQGAPIIISAGKAIISAGPNGVLDPGETVTVALGIRNTAGSLACTSAALTGTVAATGGVTTPSAPQNYGAMCGGGPIVYRNFTFTVNSGLACGGAVTASLTLTDGATNYGTFTHTFTTGNVFGVVENFDTATVPALPANWTATQGTNTGGSPFWVTSNAGAPAPVAVSAPNSIFTPDPPSVLDNRVVTPIFTYSAGQTLTFKHNFDLEQSSATVAFDAAVLEISLNGGAFVDIVTAGGSFVSGGYNHTSISTSFSNPLLPSRPNWSGNSGGFVTVVANMPPAGIGQSAQLRWRMGSDTSVSATGWRIDDVLIGSAPTCGGSAPAVSSAVSRKAHGGAGTFDLPLPLVPFNGAVGIEPRSAVAGAHQVVVTFANPVSVSGVSVSTGAGTATASAVGAVVTVDLTGVSDAQRMEITLAGVSDGANLGSIRVPMGLLSGDVNGSGGVTGSDVSQTKAGAATGTVNGSTYRSDVNAGGSINATDVSIVKSKSGGVLPP